MNNNIFYTLAAGFTLGIFISSFVKMGFSFFIFLFILSALIFIFGKLFAQSKTVIVLLAIFILFFGLGILRYEIKEIHPVDKLNNLVGERVTIQGIVIEEPKIKEQSVQLTIFSDNVSVLVSTALFPEFEYGDEVKVEGKLEKPENFLTDNDKEFDYVGYLAKEDIFYQISFAKVDKISAGHGSFIKEQLFTFKNTFIKKLNILIKEPESSLLGGLLLGAKNSLGKELQTDFRVAGVSHIVALSGYNITIVAMGIMALLAFLPRFLAVSFGVLGILLFTIMTGGGATVVRAAIMALLVLFSKMTNRKSDISRILVLAGVFMLIQNPKVLVFDLSFQLSFLATVALIFVSPLVEKKMLFITEKYKLRELTVATISTQIFVLPFLLYKMGLFSVYALPVNILILPMIPVVMLLGFIAGALGFISIYLAMPVAFICSLLLSYMLKVINIFSHLPFSSLSIENFPLILTVVIYLVFFVIILKSNNLPFKLK